MPEDTETFTLSIDNIYGTPWDIYTLDINGEGERVPGEFQPFSLEFGTGFVTYEGGAYIRIVAPDDMDRIGYLRVVYSYDDGKSTENEVYDEYINGIPVVGTMEDNGDDFVFTTNETEVYIKVFMANGMYYNFEADSSIEKTMYVYLPDDMDNAVDSDSYPYIYSRVVDFDEYDESGYAYVKLVSSSGALLGTITCTLAAAPMGY